MFPNGMPSWYGSLIGGMTDASGYQYRRNRYFDPTTGRFTQEDPIGLAGGMNLYGFANGDPVSYADPFGLCPKLPKCGAWGNFIWGIHGAVQGLTDPPAGVNKDSRAYKFGVGLGSFMHGFTNPYDGMDPTFALAAGPFPGFRDWGKNKVKWGAGGGGRNAGTEAAERARTITQEEAAQLEPGQVQQARDFYQNAVEQGQGGEAAVERVKLMDRILELQRQAAQKAQPPQP
jgi:RHS repeat-associated protein